MAARQVIMFQIFSMEMRLGSKLLWEIVSGEEPFPTYLKRTESVDPVLGTPVKNLSIDFLGGSSSRSSIDEDISELNMRLIQVAREWKNRHDRANYFIKESLSLTEYGLAKAKSMDMYRNDVAKAWKELLKTFCIGNLMFK